MLTQGLPFPGTMLPSRQAATAIPIPGVAVHGQSFATRAVREPLALAYPKPLDDHFNIGLLHTACGSTEHDNYAPCTPAELRAKGYDYWALGHVHQRLELSRDPWIVFPGNVQGRHIREEGSKGASLVRVEAGRVAAVTHHALDVLRWRRLVVDVGGADDGPALLGRVALQLDAAVVEAEGRLLIVRLVLEGASAAHGELAGNAQRTLATLRASRRGNRRARRAVDRGCPCPLHTHAGPVQPARPARVRSERWWTPWPSRPRWTPNSRPSWRTWASGSISACSTQTTRPMRWPRATCRRRWWRGRRPCCGPSCCGTSRCACAPC